ncbi:MAG: hypothetical protein ACI3VB_09715 [Oscillospiraceae bacterium]
MEPEKKRRTVKTICVVSIVLFIAAVIVCAYIIINRVGQVEGVECGPGQYYYTDIPNWKEYFLKDYYDNHVPTVILIALFFIWGFLMYKLWGWLDRKFK